MDKYILLHIGEYLYVEDIRNLILTQNSFKIVYYDYYIDRICLEYGIKEMGRDKLILKYSGKITKYHNYISNNNNDVLSHNNNFTARFILTNNNQILVYYRDHYYIYSKNIKSRLMIETDNISKDYEILDSKYIVFRNKSSTLTYIFDTRINKIVSRMPGGVYIIYVHKKYSVGYYKLANTYTIKNKVFKLDIREKADNIAHNDDWIFVRSINMNLYLISRSHFTIKNTLNNVISFCIQNSTSRLWVITRSHNDQKLSIFSIDNDNVHLIKEITINISLPLPATPLAHVGITLYEDRINMKAKGNLAILFHKIHTGNRLYIVNTKNCNLVEIDILLFPKIKRFQYCYFNLTPNFLVISYSNHPNKILVDLRNVNYQTKLSGVLI